MLPYPKKSLATKAIRVWLSAALVASPWQLFGLVAMAESTSPAGTLLLPLTPMLDVQDDSQPQIINRKAAQPAAAPKKTQIAATPPAERKKNKAKKAEATKPQTQAAAEQPVEEAESTLFKSPTEPAVGALPLTPGLPTTDSTQSDNDDPELANLESINDNSLLKGTVQIVADDTEYDQNKNTFLGTGNAVATIGGQEARLEADMILYDQNTQIMDARGNVKIIRQGEISTGSSFKFKVTSDEYIITKPDTEINGTQVIARTATGTKAGMSFKKGIMTMANPVHIARNPFFGTLQSSEDTMYKNIHPDAYAPVNPSFVFKARKMVYEKYKEQGNFTIFGGRLVAGRFSIPLGKFQATVGKESNVVFPITPNITNNMQMGGMNIGPKFSYALGKGVFYWSPMVQLGGYQTNGSNDKGRLGASAQLGYIGPRVTAQAAYGSNSNLLVATLKYQINNSTNFQSGINKYLPDGLFGPRRARSIMEIVDNRYVGGIPYLTGINFRTSAGWMSDQPSLLNLTPEYKQLFTMTNGNITSGYRIQEQLIANSHPLFALGDRKYGVNMNLFGGVAGKAYSTGDSLLMGQIGPILNVNLNRARVQGMVTKSAVRGQSPFVFDQFIQGSKSASLSADVKLCKWLTVGTNLAYNMDLKMLYQKSFSCAIGPDDFKLLLSRDTIRGINRFGFDVIVGPKIPFDKLVLKGSPDHGQLGGI
ncbi:MAG: hypothetical protein K2W82_05015 [Candidatus Obscuribacterales bacterium]|nr:hypothetical protein [Candidatus Obscuribacterales bacterium]